MQAGVLVLRLNFRQPAPQTASTHQRHPPMNKPESEKTILLVDDEQDIRDVLSIALSDMGYHVFTANNASNALLIFMKENPPIVLTDIKMPNMDGIELLKRIKRENPHTEVIMITGHGDMNLAIKSLKNEATDFITKPINVDALDISLKRANEKIITRKKLQEYTENLERLVREKMELQDHLSSLGLMIGSISHGIKGLLTGLDGGMYLLDAGLKKENLDQLKEGWEIVKLMVERIRKMVQDILLYAKERDLKKERVDVLAFAKEVALIVEPKISKAGIIFDRDFDPSIDCFEVDAGYINAALVNILDNAVDACIKDSSGKAHRIIFGVRQNETDTIFTVRDNGVGMDMETRQKVFSLFYSSKGKKGTGLGLFIANKFVGQHGGSIYIESMRDQGATFTVTIPRASNQ
jgi:signal transduction histidine kinase